MIEMNRRKTDLKIRPAKDYWFKVAAVNYLDSSHSRLSGRGVSEGCHN